MAAPQPELKFEARHNTTALLDPNLPEARPFETMINFLRRSRIYHAVTATCPISYDLIEQFWTTADYRLDLEVPTIVATVATREIQITEELVRQVLRFGDNVQDRVDFPYPLIVGCFERMGYAGAFNDSQLRKTNLSPNWRFLMHMLIVCLSARKAGLDGIGQTMQSAMVALVLNKPYNFSRYVFSSMANNISSPQHKFLMFPRFVQLLMNAQVADLPMAGQTMKLTLMQK